MDTPTDITPETPPREPHWYDIDDLKWAVRHWAARMGLNEPRIELAPLKDKWGYVTVVTSTVHSRPVQLTLNTELLRLPRVLGEFVIVHELAHLVAPNHGRLFKVYMSAYLPDWQERQRMLKGYGSSRKPAG